MALTSNRSLLLQCCTAPTSTQGLLLGGCCPVLPVTGACCSLLPSASHLGLYWRLLLLLPDDVLLLKLALKIPNLLIQELVDSTVSESEYTNKYTVDFRL